MGERGGEGGREGARGNLLVRGWGRENLRRGRDGVGVSGGICWACGGGIYLVWGGICRACGDPDKNRDLGLGRNLLGLGKKTNKGRDRGRNLLVPGRNFLGLRRSPNRNQDQEWNPLGQDAGIGGGALGTC